jgi:hypothetical protein
MADNLKTGHFANLLRHVDELLAEAARLREQITAAMRKDERPFWPDRRYSRQPHDPERRGNRNPS